MDGPLIEKFYTVMLEKEMDVGHDSDPQLAASAQHFLELARSNSTGQLHEDALNQIQQKIESKITREDSLASLPLETEPSDATLPLARAFSVSSANLARSRSSRNLDRHLHFDVDENEAREDEIAAEHAREEQRKREQQKLDEGRFELKPTKRLALALIQDEGHKIQRAFGLLYKTHVFDLYLLVVLSYCIIIILEYSEREIELFRVLLGRHYAGLLLHGRGIPLSGEKAGVRGPHHKDVVRQRKKEKNFVPSLSDTWRPLNNSQAETNFFHTIDIFTARFVHLAFPAKMRHKVAHEMNRLFAVRSYRDVPMVKLREAHSPLLSTIIRSQRERMENLNRYYPARSPSPSREADSSGEEDINTLASEKTRKINTAVRSEEQKKEDDKEIAKQMELLKERLSPPKLRTGEAGNLKKIQACLWYINLVNSPHVVDTSSILGITFGENDVRSIVMKQLRKQRHAREGVPESAFDEDSDEEEMRRLQEASEMDASFESRSRNSSAADLARAYAMADQEFDEDGSLISGRIQSSASGATLPP